jgi:hypothetical protein
MLESPLFMGLLQPLVHLQVPLQLLAHLLELLQQLDSLQIMFQLIVHFTHLLASFLLLFSQPLP